MTEQPQNVILLSADALRADHLSCYDYHRETSPVLNGLAEESIRFTNAYSASSHTREAVPALLTGKYPDVAIDSKYHLASDTIASALSEEGFATGGFHSNPFVSRAYGFDRGFDEFDDDLHLGKHKLIALAQRALNKLQNRHYARAEEINERSLGWIDSLDDDQPFFLWNHYLDTHGPYEPPEEYATLYTDTEISDRDAQSLYQRAIKKPGSISEDERQLLIDLYDAEIRYNDEKLGELLEALRERDLLEESLLVFTSDHGDAFGEHGYYEHPRYLHEEITKVPLLVHSPSGVNCDKVTQASTLDIATTIGDIISIEGKYEGESLLNISGNERTVFLQARGEDEHSHLRRYASRTATGACFCERNLETESIQFDSCTDRSHQSELKTHVKERVEREHGGFTPDSKKINDEVERRLNALGYTD